MKKISDKSINVSTLNVHFQFAHFKFQIVLWEFRQKEVFNMLHSSTYSDSRHFSKIAEGKQYV